MKKLILATIISTSLVLSGCWDMMEINNRIYPYSVGYDIDVNPEGKYKITYSYPNILALGKNPTSDKKTYVVTKHGDTAFEAKYRLSKKVAYPLDLKHLKVIIFSQDVLNNEDMIREITDGIMRDFIANKSTQLIVTKVSAEKLLQDTLNATEQQIVGGVIYNLLLNRQGSAFFTPITMSNFNEDMDISKSAIIPVGYSMNNEVFIEGGAVIKDYKLVGFLLPKENRAIAHLNNKVRSDGVNFDYKGVDITLMITESKSKKKLISQDENLKMKLNLTMEGHIHSFTNKKGMEIDTNQENKEIEMAAAKVVEGELQKAVDKVQKELKADVLFIGSYLNKFHPKLWKEIEKDWDKIYPEIDIDLDVEVKIRRRGLIK